MVDSKVEQIDPVLLSYACRYGLFVPKNAKKPDKVVSANVFGDDDDDEDENVSIRTNEHSDFIPNTQLIRVPC